MKKRCLTIWIAAIAIAIATFFTGRHYSERARQARNVRHQVQWFVMSLGSGNERVVADYLAQPNMDPNTMGEMLRDHARSILQTDFDEVPLRLQADGPRLLATFSCPDGIQLRFASTDGGDVWRFYDIREHEQ